MPSRITGSSSGGSARSAMRGSARQGGGAMAGRPFARASTAMQPMRAAAISTAGTRPARNMAATEVLAISA